MLLNAIILSLLAGSAIFFGALLASHDHIKSHVLRNEVHHFITALGAGALLAAIALVLIPQGIGRQPLYIVAIAFIAGGILAMLIDSYGMKKKSPISQFVAMVLDFVPETIVIGAIITQNFKEALLIAVIIFVQNLPESFNAYREISKNSKAKRPSLLLKFLFVSLTGPIYIVLGVFFVAGSPVLLDILMIFCAGGIVYLIFNDIAPDAKMEGKLFPPMGALIGFLIGIIGYQMTL